MQLRDDVQIVEADENGHPGRALGPAEVISKDAVVLGVTNRGVMPTQPLLVLVPVAAGGDRDEHRTIPVVEVIEPETDDPCLALVLATPLPGHLVPAQRTLKQADHPEGVLGLAATADSRPWFCRVFPRFCS